LVLPRASLKSHHIQQNISELKIDTPPKKEGAEWLSPKKKKPKKKKSESLGFMSGSDSEGYATPTKNHRNSETSKKFEISSKSSEISKPPVVPCGVDVSPGEKKRNLDGYLRNFSESFESSSGVDRGGRSEEETRRSGGSFEGSDSFPRVADGSEEVLFFFFFSPMPFFFGIF
jgi:hypothetical protein